MRVEAQKLEGMNKEAVVTLEQPVGSVYSVTLNGRPLDIASKGETGA